MLTVSDAYKTVIADINRTDRITGTITLVDGTVIPITDEIIINNSVTLSEQLVSGDTFEIGTFYTNKLNITVYDENYLTRTYANAKIKPYYGLQLPDGTWEDIPLGIFTVDNSLTKRKGSIHALTAFDKSVLFDVDISTYSGGSKTVAAHITDMCADIGVELENSDLSRFPNYDTVVDPTGCAQIQTYRDLMEWCCALMGSSALISRYGKLKILLLQESVTIDDEGNREYDFAVVFGGDERTGTEFFDLRALIKYASTTFDGEQYVKTLPFTLNDEMGRNAVINIAENPLLSGLSNAKTVWENSLSMLKVSLRSAEFTTIGNPAVECFDTIGVKGGKIDLGRTIAVFPTSIAWKYRGGQQIKCAFAELTEESTLPVQTLSDSDTAKLPVEVKSKTEKRIDGVGQKAASAGGVGKFTNSAKTAEIFNDYSGNKATGGYSHAEGFETAAGGDYSHAEGWGTLAKSVSHAEGEDTSADKCSHAEGRQANATGEYCHAEGYETTATGIVSHAEGQRSASSGWASHAEGFETAAGGDYSHAEGYNTISQQNAAHAEGYETRAGGAYSHAQNKGTVAQYSSNTAMGKYNEKGKDLALAVGNGTSDTSRSNALELDWNGNLTLAGKINSEAVEIETLTNLEIHDLIVLANG